MSKAKLERATFEFSQEAHCWASNEDLEILNIECLSSLGVDNDGDCFYVLKTDGWAIDSIEELQELIDRIQKTIKGGEQ